MTNPEQTPTKTIITTTSQDGSRHILLERIHPSQWALPSVTEQVADQKNTMLDLDEKTTINLHAVPSTLISGNPNSSSDATETARLFMLHHSPVPHADGHKTRTDWLPLDEKIIRQFGGLCTDHSGIVSSVIKRLANFDNLMGRAQTSHGAGEFNAAQDLYRQAQDLLPDPLERGRAMRGAAAAQSRQNTTRSYRALVDIESTIKATLDEQQKVRAYAPAGSTHVEREIAQAKGLFGRTIVKHSAILEWEPQLIARQHAAKRGQEGVTLMQEAHNVLREISDNNDHIDQCLINILSHLALGHALYGDPKRARTYASDAWRFGLQSESKHNPTSAQLSRSAVLKARQRAFARGVVAQLVSALPGTAKPGLTQDIGLIVAQSRFGL